MSGIAMAELERQQRLLALLRATDATEAPHPLGLAAGAVGATCGLQAYRANAQASAVRALGAAFPTLAAMLGERALAAVARDHWQAHPPVRGDLAEWGAELPAWLAAQPSLADWPWLADAARVDWALHQAERAADASFDADSLQRLGDTDPARLRLRWRPGTVLLASRWPIATLHAAHQRGADDAALAEAREAIAAGRGEAVLVARAGWRAVVHRVAQQHLPWLRAVDAGRDLASALDAAGSGFDFAAWLALALQSGWLQGVAVADD